MSAQSAERDELAEFLVNHDTAVGNFVSRSKAYDGRAAAILAAGFRKPRIIRYLVVGRDGRPLEVLPASKEEAQALAGEWTGDCKEAGIDWDYRVAEVVEAAQ